MGVHVLNVARLEWHCQIRLKYGTSPLGWDGFTWLGNSLVFMRQFGVDIVSPNDLHWRMNEEKKNETKQSDKDENLVITPQKFDELLQQQKGKEICVLSIGEYWWDLHADVLDVILGKVDDDQLSRLILEYAGMKWAMLSFPYPEDVLVKKKDD